MGWAVVLGAVFAVSASLLAWAVFIALQSSLTETSCLYAPGSNFRGSSTQKTTPSEAPAFRSELPECDEEGMTTDLLRLRTSLGTSAAPGSNPAKGIAAAGVESRNRQ